MMASLLVDRVALMMMARIYPLLSYALCVYASMNAQQRDTETGRLVRICAVVASGR